MPSAQSKLLLPPQHLAGSIFAGIYRDTRAAGLSGDDQLNHFPASPLVTVTRVLHGAIELVPDGPCFGRLSNAQDDIFVIGPQDGPITSRSLGDVSAITLGIYHDAWLALGADPRFETCPQTIKAPLSKFCGDGSAQDEWPQLCNHLSDAWPAANGSNKTQITNWARAVMTRAALASPGRSLRSFERRLKRISGQTRRTLDFFSSVEGLHQIAQTENAASAAEIAYSAGYADQSHMGRAVRRATGFTPVQLNKAIETKEAFWCYRLLGERF